MHLNGNEALDICLRETKEIFGIDRFRPSAGFVYEYTRNYCGSNRDDPILKSHFLERLSKAIKNWKKWGESISPFPFKYYAFTDFI